MHGSCRRAHDIFFFEEFGRGECPYLNAHDIY
jgi:hypothetical protein